MEEKMLNELQKTVLHIKSCYEEPLFAELKRDYQIQYNTEKRLVEAVTGRKVVVHRWVVSYE